MHRLMTIMFLVMLSLCTLNIFGDSSPAIQNAANQGKHLFVFFYKDKGKKTLRLQNIFEQTIQKMGEVISSTTILIKINLTRSRRFMDQHFSTGIF